MRIELRIKEKREEKGLTLIELSKLSGISKSHLGYLEKNERMPTIKTLCLISEALKVDEKELYRKIKR